MKIVLTKHLEERVIYVYCEVVHCVVASLPYEPYGDPDNGVAKSSFLTGGLSK